MDDVIPFILFVILHLNLNHVIASGRWIFFKLFLSFLNFGITIDRTLSDLSNSALISLSFSFQIALLMANCSFAFGTP